MTTSAERIPRVQFAHGLEGNPKGKKARLFESHFVASIPAMDTRDFLACVETHATEIQRFKPDILIGSSFGAGVVVELMRRHHWNGPTLLLAQAASQMLPDARLPKNVHVWLIHGKYDKVIDPQDSQNLAKTGTDHCVRIYEIDDDHSLGRSVENGTIIKRIFELYEAASPPKHP